MVDTNLLVALLDSLKCPILFADINHITRYMNRAAIDHYTGGADLIGRSIMDCHNENSQRIIVEILTLMLAGEVEERLIYENDEEYIFMRAVRDEEGQLLGYYERYVTKQG